MYNKKKKEIVFPDIDLTGVDHQQKLNKLKKTKMMNMINMIKITTTHKTFTVRGLIMMKILIRNNWMSY